MGRRIPTEKDVNPPLFRMSIFAPDPVSAKSRFWYFMKRLKKLKKSVGEICYCGVVSKLSDLRDLQGVVHDFACGGLDLSGPCTKLVCTKHLPSSLHSDRLNHLCRVWTNKKTTCSLLDLRPPLFPCSF